MSSAVDPLILAAAAKTGGFTCRPLGTLGRNGVRLRCLALAADGKLHKAKVSHRVVRWYDTAERAQAAVDMLHLDRARKVAYVVASTPRLLDQSPAVITEHTKVTVCPPFVPRFQTSSAIQFGLQRGRVTR